MNLSYMLINYLIGFDRSPPMDDSNHSKWIETVFCFVLKHLEHHPHTVESFSPTPVDDAWLFVRRESWLATKY